MPCLHGIPILEIHTFAFHVNLYQYISTIPKVRGLFLSICSALMKSDLIHRIRIECEGTVPRKKTPLWINELDLERGRWVIAALLQPFMFLRNIREAQILIIGGPLNEP